MTTPITLQKICMAVVLLLLLVASSVASARAQTLSPWWHVSLGTRPTYLQPGQAKNEVQRVTVPVSTVEYVLEDTGAGLFERTGNGHRVTLERGETPVQVQAALEGEELYGKGNVEVSEVGQQVYDVKFTGRLTDLPVGTMRVIQGETQVTELEKGRPDGEIDVTAVNLGDAPTSGPVTVSDVVPPGLRAVTVEGAVGENGNTLEFGKQTAPLECSLSSLQSKATCLFTGTPPPGVTFNGYPQFVPPFELIRMRVGVNVNGAHSGDTTAASITGGGAPATTASRRITVSATPPPFGVSAYEIRPEAEGGGLDTQAGSHPFQLTTTFNLNETIEARLNGSYSANSVGLAKDLHFRLPPGLIGNPTATPRCPIGQFLANLMHVECPADTVMGVALSTVNLFNSGHNLIQFAEPVFNLEPEAGEPARFGFIVDEQDPIVLDTAVRTGGDYGVTVSSTNITEQVEFISSEVTFWGVPGNEAHNNARGEGCLLAATRAARSGVGECPPFSTQTPPPFLSLPTSCTGGPLQTSAEADSWQEPHNVHSFSNTEVMVTLDGCNRLPFAPEIKVTPDGVAASSPMGFNVDVHVSQEGQLNPEGLAQSNVKDITVALPEGVAVNPAGGNGLAACSEDLADFEGMHEFVETEPGEQLATFSSYIPGDLAAKAAVARGEDRDHDEDETFNPGINFCPNASKIGEVTIHSPLLPSNQPLKGFVYVATQNENPFGSLLALYLVAEDLVSGTVFKAAGETHLTPSGQVIGTFRNNPQLAFEDAELHFFGGERAPLSSPSRCGPYTTNATFTPWSGGKAVGASSSFNITSGPHSGPCTYPGQTLPFSPSLTGGTTNNNAGSFTPLTTTIGREDGNQDLGSVQLHMPPGLTGLLSSVKLCPEAQANEGTCGPESLIGETTVSAGIGNDPVTVQGGRVYITEHYAGAPFGLSIVNPVKAGPFDLEHDTSNPAQQPLCDCVVVRAKLELDPHTLALTATTDPSGPHAIPHLIDGIPVQVKKVNVIVNRPGFTLNPTNCEHLALTGTILSDEGASAPVSVPFQATNCSVLKFTPKFTASTSGQTSKAKGASLYVNVSYPKGPLGSQANIKSVKVDLPHALPSRLTTLQKACTAAQFASNPAGCPVASVVGHAKVITPLLPVPLEGPAYFVSNGGEAFPNLIMVLQGYGITADLVGDTFINKAGITSSTFKATPDQPFSSFELNLPEGRYSALASNTNLCAPGTKTKTVRKRITVRRKGRTLHLTRRVKQIVPERLLMPTRIVGQNGAVITQDTGISVTGCHKAKKKAKSVRRTKAAKHRAKKKH
jgi:hypothetical protein